MKSGVVDVNVNIWTTIDAKKWMMFCDRIEIYDSFVGIWKNESYFMIDST